MFSQLIEKAVDKAGNKSALARIINEQRPRVVEYASLTRTPTDVFILKIADYLNLDKGETLYKAKLELDPENAELWKWCARRESNPRPSASETYQAQQLITLVYGLLSLLTRQLQHIARNQGERIALCYQYRHALTNP